MSEQVKKKSKLPEIAAILIAGVLSTYLVLKMMFPGQLEVPLNSSSAAVVSTTSGNWYGQDSEYNSIVGQFSAGQHFCMIGALSGVVDGEPRLTVQGTDGNYLSANNDGSFKPDTALNGCQSIAELAPYQDVTRSTTQLLGLPAVIIALLIFLAVRNPSKGLPAEPISEQEAAILYPGFIVNSGDFLRSGLALFRVNSNGRRVYLKKWFFDENTGEFYRIKGKQGDNTIFERHSYSERVLELWGFRRTFIIGGVVCVLIACIGLLFSYPYNIIWIGAWGAIAAQGLLLKNSRETAWLGPEPLKRTIHDFGPESASASPDHPAQDDLAYKPASYDASYAQTSELATQSTAAVCHACFGSRVQSCNCTGGRLLCSSCGGSGRKWVNTGWGQGHDETCSSCASRGYSECSICQGSGKLTCAACGGRG